MPDYNPTQLTAAVTAAVEAFGRPPDPFDLLHLRLEQALIGTVAAFDRESGRWPTPSDPDRPRNAHLPQIPWAQAFGSRPAAADEIARAEAIEEARRREQEEKFAAHQQHEARIAQANRERQAAQAQRDTAVLIDMDTLARLIDERLDLIVKSVDHPTERELSPRQQHQVTVIAETVARRYRDDHDFRALEARALEAAKSPAPTPQQHEDRVRQLAMETVNRQLADCHSLFRANLQAVALAAVADAIEDADHPNIGNRLLDALRPYIRTQADVVLEAALANTASPVYGAVCQIARLLIETQHDGSALGSVEDRAVRAVEMALQHQSHIAQQVEVIANQHITARCPSASPIQADRGVGQRQAGREGYEPTIAPAYTTHHPLELRVKVGETLVIQDPAATKTLTIENTGPTVLRFHRVED